jgi:hypothetical protein
MSPRHPASPRSDLHDLDVEADDVIGREKPVRDMYEVAVQLELERLGRACRAGHVENDPHPLVDRSGAKM